MFLLLDVSDTGLSGYEFMRALYERRKVSVLDGAAFGRQTAHFVRLCFATEASHHRRGLREDPPVLRAGPAGTFVIRTIPPSTWHRKVSAPAGAEFS